ncbi:MAG TPA: tetratricopeptide repeat protein [Gemmatimonadaceae bacterium]|jgi:tetratricopeptide (TPR) repeat protein
MANSARIDELRKKFDENPRRYFAPLANEYRKSGDLQQAIFICQEYLPQQPGHMSGHIVYGQALFEADRADEALAVFETALSLDPENLIALKHLGDIARQNGDLKGARIWYQRVLEADPRNEEIAQLMISLLAVPEAPPVPAPEPAVHAPSPGQEPLSREPLRSSAAFAPSAADEELIVEKSENAPEPRSATPANAPVIDLASPPALPHREDSTKALDGHDYLSLDDFDLGGASAAGAASAANVADSMTPSEDAPVADSGFDLGTEDGPFEVDPFAIASAPQPDEAPSDADELESPEPTESLSGLETFEPGVIDSSPSANVSLEREEFLEELPAEPQLSSEPVAAPQTFVTETMAELYLRQGHLEAALDIYRQLVEQRPNDSLLLERQRFVETRVRDEAAAAAAATETIEEPPVYGGPTIREFLSGLASRRTPVFAETVHEQLEPAPYDANSYAADFGDGALSPSSSAMDAESQPAHSTSAGSVSGSIDALFGGAEASASDASAATTLHEAFAAEGPEATPLRGVPAHTASSELSLDHVFKGNAPPPADNDAFSFDQFFAEEMTDAAPNAGGEGSAPAQPADDIAQFNAWLNGLKKT